MTTSSSNDSVIPSPPDARIQHLLEELRHVEDRGDAAERVEVALRRLPIDMPVPATREQMLSQVARFLAVARPGSGSRPLKRSHALDQAAALIDAAYQDHRPHTLDAAFADAMDEQRAGPRAVIDRVAAAVIQQAQARRARAAIDRLLDPLDWVRRRDMTDRLLKELAPDLPAPPIGYRYRPEELVDELDELIHLYTASRGVGLNDSL